MGFAWINGMKLTDKGKTSRCVGRRLLEEHVRLEQTQEVSLITSEIPLMCVSWAPYVPRAGEPITAPVEAIFNWTIPVDEFLVPSRIRAYCRDGVRAHGRDPRKSLVLLTSVPQVALQRCRVQDDRTDLVVEAFCTAGLGNAVAPGDPTLYHEEFEAGVMRPGTVNVIVGVNRRLAKTALFELVQVVTMAKCQALFRFGKHSHASGRIVLGTGTDCTVVAGLLEHPIRLHYGGMAVRVGELVARAVEDVVWSAVNCQRQHVQRQDRRAR